MVYDAVVYGGTPSGVAAAVAAARADINVALVVERRTVGGMMSNGLSASDVGARSAVRGIAREVFERIDAFYGGASDWRVEPHVSEMIFRQMLDEAGVTAYYDSPVLSVERSEAGVSGLRINNGLVRGRTFVDASYAGDLFSAAGCQFRLGMADIFEYGEPLAQRRSMTKILNLDADDEVVRFNPFVKIQSRKHVQDGMPSITYRLCLSEGDHTVEIEPGNRYPEQSQYFRALVRGYLNRDAARAQRVDVKSNGTLHSAYYQLAKIPNFKYDLNSGWASFTNVVTSKAYFANIVGRDQYHSEVAEFVRNFFRFLQTDPTVPTAVREPFRAFGLAGTEFEDNNFWPYEPYLREGRRVVGRHTLTERDIFVSRRKIGGVAVGSYPVDSKLTQLIVWQGGLYRDIGPHVRVPQYEIPYWCMLPSRGPQTCSSRWAYPPLRWLLVPCDSSHSSWRWGKRQELPRQWL